MLVLILTVTAVMAVILAVVISVSLSSTTEAESAHCLRCDVDPLWRRHASGRVTSSRWRSPHRRNAHPDAGLRLVEPAGDRIELRPLVLETSVRRAQLRPYVRRILAMRNPRPPVMPDSCPKRRPGDRGDSWAVSRSAP